MSSKHCCYCGSPLGPLCCCPEALLCSSSTTSDIQVPVPQKEASKQCQHCGSFCDLPPYPLPSYDNARFAKRREEVHTGDLNSTEKGTGARKNRGKSMFSLVPLHLLGGVARVMTGGTLKYAPFNWGKGMLWSVSYDCAIRHMFKWWYAREDDDHESAEHHLDHAICNLLYLKHYLSYYPEGDDRPPEGMFTTEDIEKLFDEDGYRERNGISVGP